MGFCKLKDAASFWCWVACRYFEDKGLIFAKNEKFDLARVTRSPANKVRTCVAQPGSRRGAARCSQCYQTHRLGGTSSNKMRIENNSFLLDFGCDRQKSLYLS